MEQFDYGKQYQKCVLKLFIEDDKFAGRIIEIIKPTYFNSGIYEEICSYIIEHYNKYNVSPEYGILLEIIKDKYDLSSSELKKKLVLSDEDNGENRIYQIVKELNLIQKAIIKNESYIKEKTIEFCRTQSIIGAVQQSIDLIKGGLYDEVVRIITESVYISDEFDKGHNYAEDIENRLRKQARNVIPTGNNDLDRIFCGGFGKKEMSLGIGFTGVGKTHFLVNWGVNALKAGFNVVYFTMELSEEIIGRRFDSNISNIPIHELLDKKEKVVNIIKDFNRNSGRLFIKEYPSMSASTETFKRYISKLKNDKFYPDIIFVDYLDEMKTSKRYKYDEKLHLELKNISRELRALAQEMGIAVVTVSQTNRSGLTGDIITMQSSSESIAKHFGVDISFTISRDKTSIENKNTGNFFIDKSRIGEDGILFKFNIDTYRSKVNFRLCQSIGEIKKVIGSNDGLSNDDKARLTMLLKGNSNDKNKK